LMIVGLAVAGGEGNGGDQGLAADAAGPVLHASGNAHGIARGHGKDLRLQPMLAAAGVDIQNLLAIGMGMQRIALARPDGDDAKRHFRARHALAADAPVEAAPRGGHRSALAGPGEIVGKLHVTAFMSVRVQAPSSNSPGQAMVPSGTFWKNW